MKSWIDEQIDCKMSEPDCVDEWLFDIWAVGCDCDGASTVEDFKFLVKELVYYSQKARDCLWEGKLFGVYGAPVRKGKEEETKIDKDIVRDCHKCVYEVGCLMNPVGCKRYKRDAPDGGYYG